MLKLLGLLIESVDLFARQNSFPDERLSQGFVELDQIVSDLSSANIFFDNYCHTLTSIEQVIWIEAHDREHVSL